MNVGFSFVLSLPDRNNGNSGDDCLLGCSAVLSGRILPTFQRCLLPPLSRRSALMMEAANVSRLLPDNTAQHPRRQSSSYSPAWETEISQCDFFWEANVHSSCYFNHWSVANVEILLQCQKATQIKPRRPRLVSPQLQAASWTNVACHTVLPAGSAAEMPARAGQGQCGTCCSDYWDRFF
jgi:hypothetical protein